jgi:hypothetical protein
MSSRLSIAENRIFSDTFSVYLTESEYELVRPVIISDHNKDDVFLHGGYDPLSTGTVYVDTGSLEHIKEILCGRPREREDDISSHITFSTSYPRHVTIDDIVELYSAFNKIEFDVAEDIVTVCELLTDWLREINLNKYVSIGYKGLSEESEEKLMYFIGSIKDKANAINIRNLGTFNSMDGAWANIERVILHKNLGIHNPDYLSETFSSGFRERDTRAKVLTKGRLVIPNRVSTEITEYDSFNMPRATQKED